MKNLLIILIFFIAGNQLMGQEIKFLNKSYSDKISINQDDAITKYMEAYHNYIKKNNGILGYRIKIYSQNNAIARTQSKTVKTQFEAQFPEQKAYQKYDDPNFEVYVGDFISKIEAIAFMNKINSKYPSAFVVKSVISIADTDN
jgi:hypothetical protein